MPASHDSNPERRDPVDAVAFDTAITTDDWVEFALRNARDYFKPRRLRGLLVAFAALALGALIGWATGGAPPTSIADLLRLDRSNVPFLIFLGLAVVLILGRYVLYDRILRRRYRRWSVREHGPVAVPVRFRLDAEAVVSTDASGSTTRRWAGLSGLEESDRQFFLLDHAGGATPIPKRDLSPTDRDRLRALVRAHLPKDPNQRDFGPATLPPEIVDEAKVVVHYDQTAWDRAAANMLLWDTPARRRLRAWLALGVPLGMIVAIVLMDALGWWLAWQGRPRPASLATAFAAFWRSEVRMLGPLSMYADLFGLATWALWPWFLRRQTLALARTHRDVPVQLAFAPSGVTVAAPATIFRYDWSGVRGVLDGREHLALVLPLSVLLPVRKTALTEADLSTLRRLLTERVQAATA